MRYLHIALTSLVIWGCNVDQPKEKIFGTWRASLKLDDKHFLPFIFEIKDDSTILILNAEEKIQVEEVAILSDSIRIKLPVFDSEIRAKVFNDKMQGFWLNNARKNDKKISFSAQKNITERFSINKKPSNSISGKWEAHFSLNSPNHYPAIGLFAQQGGQVNGTFLTPTGDYRYLEGVVNGDSLFLSCFDGAHAFLFKARIFNNDSIQGIFLAGNHWKESWYAVRNGGFQLPDADTLTYLKSGYSSLSFAFPNLDSNIVSLNDSIYKNKAVIIQIMGSWCPNCKDETEFLSSFYNQYKKKDSLALIAIAYENAPNFSKAKQILTKLIREYDINYEVLIGQIGTTNKQQAGKTLPMLNHILSYPTTIFLNKNHDVEHIHTGFTGPATGNHYDDFVEKFHVLVERITK